jgi:hypothetical protein
MMTNTNFLDLCRPGLSSYDALTNAEIIGQLTIQLQFADLWMDPTSNSPPRQCICIKVMSSSKVNYLRVSSPDKFSAGIAQSFSLGYGADLKLQLA